jgi:type VI protein secretion system component Hcp
MNEVQRFLVDKKLVEIDGKEHYKLYFYDSMDGVIVTIVAPVVTPQNDKEKESIEQQYPSLEEDLVKQQEEAKKLYDLNMRIE